MNRDVLVTFWETDLKDEYLETFANKAKTNPSLNTTRFNVQFEENGSLSLNPIFSNIDSLGR